MKELKFNPGDVIFKEGEDSRQAYWLSTGRVGITIRTASGSKMLAQLGPGQLFGEMGLIDDLPRSATATALEATEVEVIDEDTFETAVIGRPERLRGYLAALFERLRTTDSQLQAEINRRAPEDAVNADATIGDVSVSIESRYTGKAAEQLSPIKQAIEHFPYRIGRKISKGMTPFVLNELEVEDIAPYNISRNHCSIEIDGGKVCLRDRGSALGTIVNQHPINVREGTVVWELRDGENEIIFGNERSPQLFIVTVGRG